MLQPPIWTEFSLELPIDDNIELHEGTVGGMLNFRGITVHGAFVYAINDIKSISNITKSATFKRR